MPAAEIASRTRERNKRQNVKDVVYVLCRERGEGGDETLTGFSEYQEFESREKNIQKCLIKQI